MPPLVFITVSWIIGLVVAHHWLVPLGVQPLPLLLLSLLPVAALVLWWHDRPLRLGAACALMLLTGALRYGSAMPNPLDPDFVATHNGQGWTAVEGVVRACSDVRDNWTQLTLDADWIELDDGPREVTGRILVGVPRYPEYAYGDRLRVSGLLEAPADLEGFPYRQYLAGRGIYSVIDWPQVERLDEASASPILAALLSARDRAHQRIAQLLPD
ncbi:MAG: DUF4131 domain-containing protein, partial [Anaerolineae bacterium]